MDLRFSPCGCTKCGIYFPASELRALSGQLRGHYLYPDSIIETPTITGTDTYIPVPVMCPTMPSSGYGFSGFGYAFGGYPLIAYYSRETVYSNLRTHVYHGNTLLSAVPKPVGDFTPVYNTLTQECYTSQTQSECGGNIRINDVGTWVIRFGYDFLTPLNITDHPAQIANWTDHPKWLRGIAMLPMVSPVIGIGGTPFEISVTMLSCNCHWTNQDKFIFSSHLTLETFV